MKLPEHNLESYFQTNLIMKKLQFLIAFSIKIVRNLLAMSCKFALGLELKKSSLNVEELPVISCIGKKIVTVKLLKLHILNFYSMLKIFVVSLKPNFL